MSELAHGKCIPCEGGLAPLDQIQATEHLVQLDPAWRLSEDSRQLSRAFRFESYQGTIAFVNAVAWIAESQDHHPDLQVGYRMCTVTYTTHAIKGLSLNDFICAAKIDALMD
jgi:4a-hydroxytetrahydrobiopterin dehydratase